MRRDIQEIEREIFSKRDEHFEKQKRRRRALGRVVPIAGGAALVFALSFAVLPALRSGTADSYRERSAYTGGSEDGTIRPETELRDGNIMSTGAPMEGDPIGQTDQPAVLPGCAEETEEPGNYSSSGGDRPPWICGTPWLEGAELSIEELLSRCDNHDGEGESALVHTAVAFAGGEEVRRFSFEGEAGRQVLELVTTALREAALQPAPVEPEETDCDFVVYFEFMDREGCLCHSRIGFTAEGFVLFNNGFLTPALPESSFAGLRAALEALCR